MSARRWQLASAAALVALSSIAWLDPHARTREGNRLFAAGKYDEAASTYNDQLVDHPDSSLLHFNLGDAQYKQGKYDEALAAFAEVRPGDEDRAATARAAYNTGNANYRLGEAIASSDPKAALERYAQALVAYRRAITAAPDDVDAKLNYELVEQKRAELQKKLEEQQKQQQQQQQQQGDKQQDKKDENQQAGQPQQKDQEQQQQQQQQDQQQQQANQPEAGPSPGGEQHEQAQGSPEPQPAESPSAGHQASEAANSENQQPDEQAGDTATTADQKREGEMTRQEAAAVLDAQRSQEVQPGEVVKRIQAAGVAEPAQDW